MEALKFGVIGGGSWATALAKILTDKKNSINWWIRQEEVIRHIRDHGRNPQYLNNAVLDTKYLAISSDIASVFRDSDVLVIAVPSAYAVISFEGLNAKDWENKKIVSAIKGILPDSNLLLNDYLRDEYGVKLEDYFAVLGPCHAEEVAAEKLSYLTFSGVDVKTAAAIAEEFNTGYIVTVVNHDIFGVQYAAVLKNIYALGAGIALGLGYGDNFLSVYIANAADEMAGFLRQYGAEHITVGEHDEEDPVTHRKTPNYAASVYLGDLLVTCYSSYSRNRNFGTMIGKGYSVTDAQRELNMVAEGYNATKCIFNLNKRIAATIPIAKMIYSVLWENVKPAEGFKLVEEVLV